MRGGLRVGGLLLSALALTLWSPVGSIVGDPFADASVSAGVDEIDPEDRVSPADLPALDEGGGREGLPADPRLSKAQPTDPPERIEPADLDPKRPPRPEFGKVDQERSSPSRLVWETAPGGFVAEEAAVPKWFKDGGGRWAPIDVSVVPLEQFPGVVQTRAGPWSASFAPIGPGTGGVSVVAEDGDRFSWRPADVSVRVAPVVSAGGLTVTYPAMWPGVDLRYRLSTVGIREEMILSGPTAPTMFSFETDQRLVRNPAAEADAARMGAWPEVQLGWPAMRSRTWTVSGSALRGWRRPAAPRSGTLRWCRWRRTRHGDLCGPLGSSRRG